LNLISYITIAIALITSISVNAEQLNTTTINVTKPIQAYPPYHWIENGEIKGIFPEIINEVAKIMGNFNVNYVVVPWKRMFELAKKGEVDAIMPININKERQAYLHFVKEALIMERMNFVTTDAFNIKYQGDLQDLANYDIAAISGYYYGENYATANLNSVALPNEETQIKMLLAGRFPVAILDTNILPYYINKFGNNSKNKIIILKPHINETALHIAFSKKSVHSDLYNQFNHALNKLKQSNKYKEILDSYLASN